MTSGRVCVMVSLSNQTQNYGRDSLPTGPSLRGGLRVTGEEDRGDEQKMDSCLPRDSLVYARDFVRSGLKRWKDKKQLK